MSWQFYLILNIFITDSIPPSLLVFQWAIFTKIIIALTASWENFIVSVSCPDSTLTTIAGIVTTVLALHDMTLRTGQKLRFVFICKQFTLEIAPIVKIVALNLDIKISQNACNLFELFSFHIYNWLGILYVGETIRTPLLVFVPLLNDSVWNTGLAEVLAAGNASLDFPWDIAANGALVVFHDLLEHHH